MRIGRSYYHVPVLPADEGRPKHAARTTLRAYAMLNSAQQKGLYPPLPPSPTPRPRLIRRHAVGHSLSAYLNRLFRT
jgi:hypothetical protein